MYYGLVAICTALFCVGMVFLLKRPFWLMVVSATKQLDVILNDQLKDKAKDKLLLSNLGKLLGYFFLTLIVLTLLIVLCSLPVYLYTHFTFGDYRDFTSMYFYGSMIAGSCVLLFFRSTSDYTYWSKLLHTIILDNYHVVKYLFRKEKKRQSKSGTGERSSEFVIVTGLARGGTTALTNLLYHADDFHSISYANMPFLLAPNMWKKIRAPRKVKKRERAHGDKVLFSENSIEALEEYFFKVHLNDSYINKHELNVHDIDEKLYANYQIYQNGFRKQANTLYLAKNNNFILRYRSMRKLDEQFRVILLFRNPVDHATSLMRQHGNFCKQQRQDSFVKSYMNWLGHHEFGEDQKVFDLGGDPIVGDKNTLDYWLKIWINYYQYVLQLPAGEHLFLIHYDDLLRSPNELKGKLGEVLNVSLAERTEVAFTPSKKDNVDMDVDQSLLETANSIYQQLMAKKVGL